MKLSDHQWQFLQHLADLITFARINGYKLTGGELERTEEMQKIYFKTGASKTMDSQHLKKLAIDLNVFFRGQLTYDWETVKVLGDFWESLDPLNRWGGDFNQDDKKNGFIDTPHFERYIK
jgi:hypothetical protein